MPFCSMFLIFFKKQQHYWPLYFYRWILIKTKVKIYCTCSSCVILSVLCLTLIGSRPAALFEFNVIKGEILWREGLGAGQMSGLDHWIFVNLYTFPWHIMAIMLVHLYDNIKNIWGIFCNQPDMKGMVWMEESRVCMRFL